MTPQIIFNIATVERRRGMFLEVLAMLKAQTIPCDKINVAMSCEHVDPDVIRYLKNHFKEHTIYHKPALTSEYKMFAFDSAPEDSNFLTFDDDIVYPENYVERLVNGIEAHERKAVIGFHGIQFQKFPVSNYKKEKTMFQYFKNIPVDIPVHVIGTGCMGFYTGTLRKKKFNFAAVDKKKNCLDGVFGQFCRHSDIPTIVLKHEADWMKIYPNSQTADALWRRSYNERYKTKLSYLDQ